MNERLTKITASIALFIGGIFGIAGSSVPSASLRSLAWGLDGVALIIAGALLTVYYAKNKFSFSKLNKAKLRNA
ncbi:MAG TPA: hypothetical protein VGQ09_16380 [Chitinophagaceae bacterium]|jgi:Mg2+ and Co2+ transporter CorA|nr:hypothetical protein [Chitinophagaceae bacterium]